MYRKLPLIPETADDLRQRMRQERNPKKRERLHMVYLLASGQASTRKAVAAQLGISRETVGHWLDRYAGGGSDHLLDLYVPTGRQSLVGPDALDDLTQSLHEPKGFGSSDEIRVWLCAQHGVTMTTDAVGHLVRHRFGGKPNVPRPIPKKRL